MDGQWIPYTHTLPQSTKLTYLTRRRGERRWKDVLPQIGAEGMIKKQMTVEAVGGPPGGIGAVTEARVQSLVQWLIERLIERMIQGLIQGLIQRLIQRMIQRWIRLLRVRLDQASARTRGTQGVGGRGLGRG